MVPSVSKVTGNSVSASLTANANVGYTSGKLSLAAGISTGYSGDDWISPKVTFSGSWGKNQSSDLNLESLDFKYSQALNGYNDAMYSYRNSIRSLETNVENHKTEVAQLDIQLDYHQRILEAKQQLFELGLCTKTELDNAQTDIDNDNFQKTILALQGIMLLNQIRLMEL